MTRLTRARLRAHIRGDRPSHLFDLIAAFLVGCLLAPFLLAWATGLIQ
jgi:hypothetical protein